METCLHFKYVITLHVVAMARTKNTARSNPIVLTQATLADHIQAIAISTDVEKDPETKDMGSNIPARVDVPQLKNVKIVECSEVVSKGGEPEPLTPPRRGPSHPSVF